MRLYRAFDDSERIDVVQTGRLRPGPPSFMGKWMAANVMDAAEWGWRFYRQCGGPFYILEIEVPDDRLTELYHNPFLDRIGPAYFAESDQLDMIRVIGFLPTLPVGVT